MDVDSPPKLNGQTSAIVRQIKSAGKSSPTSQTSKCDKTERDDGWDASQLRAGEPGSK